MAPRIGKGRRTGTPVRGARRRGAGRRGRCADEQGDGDQAAELRRELGELRSKIESNCDYVGGRSTKEAREYPLWQTEPPAFMAKDHLAKRPASCMRKASSSPIPWLPQRDSGTHQLQAGEGRRGPLEAHHVIDVEVSARRKPPISSS